MKTLLFAAAIAAISALNLAPALAADAPNAPPPAPATGNGHWEWQYHYVGHHPRYEGHWVLVQ